MKNLQNHSPLLSASGDHQEYTVSMDPVLQQVSDEPFREFFQYWTDLKGDKPIPEVEDFQLADIPHFVADIVIAEFVGGRILFRYSGANFNRETGRDLTRLYMDDLSNVEDLIERAQLSRKAKKPFLISNHPVTWTSRKFKRYSALAVPLANAAGEVARLVYLLTHCYVEPGVLE